MVRSATALQSNVRHLPDATKQIYLVHNRVDKMSFDEFREARQEMFSRNRNRTLNFFNRQGEDYKFCVMTLVNRSAPGTFSTNEIGNPFESFDLHRRELIITAMNKLNRWGELLPGKFKLSDSLV